MVFRSFCSVLYRLCPWWLTLDSGSSAISISLGWREVLCSRWTAFARCWWFSCSSGCREMQLFTTSLVMPPPKQRDHYDTDKNGVKSKQILFICEIFSFVDKGRRASERKNWRLRIRRLGQPITASLFNDSDNVLRRGRKRENSSSERQQSVRLFPDGLISMLSSMVYRIHSAQQFHDDEPNSIHYRYHPVTWSDQEILKYSFWLFSVLEIQLLSIATFVHRRER